MKSIIFLLIISIFIPWQAHSQQGVSQLNAVPRISAAVAYKEYKKGAAVLIDAMGAKTYASKHILGSISIPNDGPQDIANVRNMELPFKMNQPLIVYCD